ncbi:hypothetical protein ACWD4B_15040 [Streptomyces sp. NPDC002536]|uniref:hypothetical protein n=1 Tax=Streptoverticillium reticulum TaxID=1433415 RepID=UPI0039BF0A75
MHDGISPADSAQRQQERARLRELVERAEAEHGPIDPDAVAAKRAVLRGGALTHH